MSAPPTDDALNAIMGPSTRWRFRAEFYESDGETLWAAIDATDGNVSVDETRDDRRTLDMRIASSEGDIFIGSGPDGIWFDKIVKPFRGVYLDDGTVEEWQLGEFMIDKVSDQNFPNTLSVTGRDYSKKLKLSKFLLSTTFTEGQSLGEIVRAIALNGGIEKMIIPITDDVIGKDFSFDKGVTRWDAIKELVAAYAYEVFFDSTGYMVMRKLQDPQTNPPSWTFETGEFGNLVSYSRSTDDSRLYNLVNVTGKAPDDSLIQASAENSNPSSPTNTDRLGERVFEYHSDFIYTEEQAQDVADTFLAIHSLQSWDMNLGSLVFPWLEVGTTSEFIDPNPSPGEPASTRWRASSLTIPFRLSTMPHVAKRVVIVG